MRSTIKFSMKSTMKTEDRGNRVIVASHQLPIVCILKDKSWILNQRFGHTALYAGINSLKCKKLQVGWTGAFHDENGNNIDPSTLSAELIASLKSELLKKNCIPVILSRAESLGHYEGFCKSSLWDLFHYVLWETATNGVAETKNWMHYKTVNRKFAEAIASIHESNDLVWIHDYHLLTLPKELREVVPNAAIGFFLHTPFPSSEVFRCLPSKYLLVIHNIKSAKKYLKVCSLRI